MKTGEPQRPLPESQRPMNSPRDSRSRLYPKYSVGSHSSPSFFCFFASSFFLPFSLRAFSCSIIRLKPVPTGSTKTTSVNASHDSSLCTSRGGISGSDPSAGNATRFGPTAPMCRYADDAPGPPLKTNVTGRSPSCSRVTYETEKISADGFSFFRSTTHFAVAVCSTPFHVAVDEAPRGGS